MSIVRATISFSIVCAFVGCNIQAVQRTGVRTESVSGTVTISGQARDAKGAPLAGVTIKLSGHVTLAQTTDANGNYAFAQLEPGSYELRPQLHDCHFVPERVDLDQLGKNAAQNFDGAGQGCSGPPVGRLTISGVINDANGLPLAGARVRLSDREHKAQRTDANGNFAFTQLVPGSYDVRPELDDCSFLPPVADLDRLTDDATVLFSGSGSGCGGSPTTNGGATNGPLTISGHLRDASGQPIVGGRIDLSGTEQAIRFSDFTGGFSFHVNPGTFTLHASGDCTFTSASVTQAITADTTVDFTATSDGCLTGAQSNVVATGSLITLNRGAQRLGITLVPIQQFGDSAQALRRLHDIGLEQPAAPRSLTIAGYPAIERQVVLPASELDAPANGGNDVVFELTTAIAVGDTVVRFESELPGDADAATINHFLITGRNFTPDELAALHGTATTTPGQGQRFPPVKPAILGFGAGNPGVIQPDPPNHRSFGELQIAAAETSNNVVYATQFGQIYHSPDQGKNILKSDLIADPNFPFTGDPTVTIGADGASGQTFYYAQLGVPTPDPNANAALLVYNGGTDGATFTESAVVIDCTTSPCFAPDQPQLAANQLTPGAQGDLLYVAWSHFRTKGGDPTIGVSCSLDGGKKWNTDLVSLGSFPGADHPRVTVGIDGSLYVLFAANNGTSVPVLNIQKFSSCDNGFQPLDPPTIVEQAFSPVPDLVGLSRAPRAQYMISADDTDPTRVILYAVYTNATASGTGEDVVIKQSLDGGKNWSPSLAANSNHSGHRFMPWVCVTNGLGYVTWYDRRDSSPQSPDLTSYFRAVIGTSGNNLFAGADINVSGVDDPQCQSGFYTSVESPLEEQQCTDLPPGQMNVGQCTCSSPPCAFCDFRSPNCPSGQTCQPIPGKRGPKYGDYNGAGCAQNQLFMAWASATPPPGALCVVDGLTCDPAGTPCCAGSTCLNNVCSPHGAFCVASGASCSPGGATCCSGPEACQGGICAPKIALYTGNLCTGTCVVTPHPGTVNVFLNDPVADKQVVAGMPVPAWVEADLPPGPGQLFGPEIPCDHVSFASPSDPSFTSAPSGFTANVGCYPLLTFGTVGLQTLVVAATDPNDPTNIGSATITVNVVPPPSGPVPAITFPPDHFIVGSGGGVKGQVSLKGVVTGGSGTITATWEQTLTNTGVTLPLGTVTVQAGTLVPVDLTTFVAPGPQILKLTVVDSNNQLNLTTTSFDFEPI